MMGADQAEAALALAIREYAPRCAEELYLRMLTARDAAPEGEGEAYADATRDVYVQKLAAEGERLVAQIEASREQIEAFAQQFVAAVLARFGELKASTTQVGGRA